jgi:transglutaminase-like putative cysteine protease
MTRRHSLALVAGAATILAAMPLVSVFDTSTWLIYTVVGVALVVGTAMLVRTLRGPAWAQVLAMLAVLLLYLTWAFPSGGEFAAIIPTGETFANFGKLLSTAGTDIRDQAVPVPDRDGLLLLTTGGVVLVAILVDLFAVALRRPALAGLPMLAIYSVPVAVLPEGVNVFSFCFAAAGYLWLLVSDSVDRVRRFGRRFSGEGRDVDLWEPSPLSSAGRRLGLVGLVVAILIPLAIPGMTTGFLDRFGTGPGGGDGAGNGTGVGAAKLDLTALLHGNLVRKEEFEMVRIRTTDPNPFYARIGVAEQVGNQGFESIVPSGGGATVTRPLPEYVVPTKPGVTSTQYKAEIEVVNLDGPLAPSYQQLIALSGLDNAWFVDEPTGQVYSKRASAQGKRYTVDFLRLSYTPAALRTAGVVPANDPGAQALRRVPIISEVTTLVGELTQGKTTEYDKVRAIYDYFGTGFSYSLAAEDGPSESPIVDFLTAKRGYCLQYAAAMAWLVRAAGYPARVAFGWTRGAGVRNGVYSLTNLNLHAWTEVYFQDFGWVPFDATPPSAVLGSAPSNWAPDPNASASGSADPSAGPDASVSPGATGALDPRDPRLPGDEGLIPIPETNKTRPWMYVLAIAAAVLLILLLAPSARRRAVRRKRQARGGHVIELSPGSAGTVLTDVAAVASARRDAHSAWAELIDTMIDYGVPVDESETPRSTAGRLGRLNTLAPPGRENAGVIAQAEERARYARLPLAVTDLDEAVRTTRAAFAERATRGQRLQAAVFPRSVLLRWRMNWILFASRNARLAARVRDTLLSVSPQRLFRRR